MLNEFVLKNQVKNIIEFGFVDGNQLKLAAYPSCLGFDVSITAINNCRNLFQPGGRLVVTIDLSLDGTREIDVDRGNLLLSALAKRFEKSQELSLDLRAQVSVPGIFTTLTARDIDPSLLPWKRRSLPRRLKSFIKTGKLGEWLPPLTVFCLSLTKRST